MQVYLADLDALHSALEQAEQTLHLLSPSELAWASSTRHDRWRRDTRIALRCLLVAAGATAARGALFAEDVHGKPGIGDGTVHFNVSHSAGRALIAVCVSSPVGVDLEATRRLGLEPRRRAMIVAAGAALAGQPATAPQSTTSGTEDEIANFLQAWTQLEAFAKARGSGMARLLGELGIMGRGSRRGALPDLAATSARDIAAASQAASGLTVRRLELPQGLFGAACAMPEAMAVAPVVRALTAQDLGN